MKMTELLPLNLYAYTLQKALYTQFGKQNVPTRVIIRRSHAPDEDSVVSVSDLQTLYR